MQLCVPVPGALQAWVAVHTVVCRMTSFSHPLTQRQLRAHRRCQAWEATKGEHERGHRGRSGAQDTDTQCSSLTLRGQTHSLARSHRLLSDICSGRGRGLSLHKALCAGSALSRRGRDHQHHKATCGKHEVLQSVAGSWGQGGLHQVARGGLPGQTEMIAAPSGMLAVCQAH